METRGPGEFKIVTGGETLPAVYEGNVLKWPAQKLAPSWYRIRRRAESSDLEVVSITGPGGDVIKVVVDRLPTE